MSLSRRSYTKEYIDGIDISFEDIKRNMRELEFINRRLGGHGITLEGFRKLAGSKKEISICEIGCGGGDNLKAINNWCRQEKVVPRFTGIDINPSCTSYAEENCRDLEQATFICSDYRLVRFTEKPDIIFSSLFCHHFTDEELLNLFRWSSENSLTGFFVNDLHRHALALHSIRLLTMLFSRSWLVRNDAPLSVRRGFRRNELERLLKASVGEGYSISWKWAFRWLAVYSHGK